MISVVQRVAWARVEVAGRVEASIGVGLMVLVGVHGLDTRADADWTAQRLAGLRVLPDQAGKMNLSVAQLPAPQDDGASVLLVPNFTLCARTGQGNRPGFADAMAPGPARALFEAVAHRLDGLGVRSRSGVFGADMLVTLANDGPVTVLLNSHDHVPRG